MSDDRQRCPSCGVVHLWGLIRKSPDYDCVVHGCRLPEDGSAFECSRCHAQLTFHFDENEGISIAKR
jgi:hypothetical protein